MNNEEDDSALTVHFTPGDELTKLLRREFGDDKGRWATFISSYLDMNEGDLIDTLAEAEDEEEADDPDQ